MKRCQCPICRHCAAERALRAALDDLGASMEDMLEHSSEHDMHLHYLLDELEVFLRRPWRLRQLRRLVADTRQDLQRLSRLWTGAEAG